MSSRPKNRLRNLLEESARNTLIQFIGFMLSTALVGGAGYLLFGAQSEADDINRLIVDAEKQTAEAKTFHDLAKIPSEGWFANSANYEQIQNIVLYLGANRFKDKLDGSFASNALNVCNSASIQLNNEKGQISGFSPQDELVKNQQQGFLAQYDNEITLVDETSGIIINWEKETADDRDKRLLSIIKLADNGIAIGNAITTQSKQIIYDVENVKLVELNRKEAEYNARVGQLQLRRILSGAGVIVGLSFLLILIIYTKKSYSEPNNRPSKKRRHSQKKTG